MKLNKIIILIIIVLIIFAASFLAKEFLKFPKISKIPEKIPKEKIPLVQFGLASGKQIFEILTDKPRDAQIIEVEIDPLDVKLGEIQQVKVKVKTKATTVTESDSVSGNAITDNKVIDFPFKLKKAEGEEELITTWQGEWKMEDSIERNYQIRIFAKNVMGQDQVTLTFR